MDSYTSIKGYSLQMSVFSSTSNCSRTNRLTISKLTSARKIPCSTPRLKERHRLLRVTFTTVFHHRIYLRIFLYILEEALVGLMKDLDAFLKDSKYHLQHIVGLLVYLLQVFVSFSFAFAEYTLSIMIPYLQKPHRAYVWKCPMLPQCHPS